ncbi:hypothetical protein B0H15DRAFT_298017 [Mycena belliarum]|uniref:Cyclin N-terminal domain-containing protein n=1 Tax=Mycena belliarum TaxID=1033014 RepID=A0AAD6U6Q2_9AGAR|nr:hypothetical protein B0H15DRAFT_298017 [Mycena belliae]
MSSPASEPSSAWSPPTPAAMSSASSRLHPASLVDPARHSPAIRRIRSMPSPASEPSSAWSPETPSSPASSPAAVSSPSSRLHPASLVDPACHSPALMQLSSMEISRPVVDYVVDAVTSTVNATLTQAPAALRGGTSSRSPYHAPFIAFTTNVLAHAAVTPSVLLTALIYVARARTHLAIAREKWARERILLGALIVASKYTNDRALHNAHWAACSGVFGKRDIGRIEREFLDVLGWDLGVTEAQVEAQWAALRSVSTHQPWAAPCPHREQRHGAPATPRPCQRKPSMPELEPSSPSSDASLSPSPRTPDLPMDADRASDHTSYAHPASCHVAYPRYPTHRAFQAPRPAPVPGPHYNKTRRASARLGGLHDLLCAFPIPPPHRPARAPRAAA